MKICTKCQKEQDELMFSKNKNNSDGRSRMCKICFSQYFKEHREQYKARYNKWRNSNLEHAREIERKNFQNPSRKEKHRLNQATRRAMKYSGTIPGHYSEIRKIYENYPPGMHVDHIVPLRGKTVCGLHVPWNLQYLTPEENHKKKNKLILKDEEK